MLTSGTVDYLTVTAKPQTQEFSACLAVYDGLKFDEVTTGLDEKPARALGYVGSKIGQMFCGTNPQGVMFRASGQLAELAAKMFAWIGGNHHVTRIDFQLTWQFGYDVDYYFDELADSVREAQTQSTLPNAPQVRHIRSYGKGDTVSIGARSSEVFIRIYDKSREQVTDPSEGLVRYEVELKGQRALQAMRLYTLGNADNHTVYQVVDFWMRDRLVNVPWGPLTALDWPPVGRPETDDERSLKWLESHVKTTVQRLCLHNHRQLVLEALGLDEE